MQFRFGKSAGSLAVHADRRKMDKASNLELFASGKEVRNAVMMDHRRGIVATVLKHAGAIYHSFYAIEMRQPVRRRCGLGDIDFPEI